MPLVRLIYLSSSIQLYSNEELAGMLVDFRSKNAGAGITGLLLYKQGCFLQVLKGEHLPVIDLYDRINRDERHKGLILVSIENIEDRHFPDWSMGFRDLDQDPLSPPEGFDEMLNRDWRELDLPSFPEKVSAFIRAFVR